MAIDKYYYFRKLLDLVNDEYDVTDADMENYCGEIEVAGKDAYGNTIKIRVAMAYEGGTENGESV